MQSRAVPLLSCSLALSLALGIFAVAGCTGSSGGGDAGTDGSSDGGADVAPGCKTHEVPASTDLAKPSVAFRKDVLPVFEQSCAFSACHGATTGKANGVFLGKGDPDRVHSAIVGRPSVTLPNMNFVTAGDAKKSFLMRKMDGDQCALDCGPPGCGSSMPRNEEPLPIEQRDVLRRWIAQGAKND